MNTNDMCFFRDDKKLESLRLHASHQCREFAAPLVVAAVASAEYVVADVANVVLGCWLMGWLGCSPPLQHLHFHIVDWHHKYRVRAIPHLMKQRHTLEGTQIHSQHHHVGHEQGHQSCMKENVQQPFICHSRHRFVACPAV